MLEDSCTLSSVIIGSLSESEDEDDADEVSGDLSYYSNNPSEDKDECIRFFQTQ
mgnify:CR=1 FL=1